MQYVHISTNFGDPGRIERNDPVTISVIKIEVRRPRTQREREVSSRGYVIYDETRRVGSVVKAVEHRFTPRTGQRERIERPTLHGTAIFDGESVYTNVGFFNPAAKHQATLDAFTAGDVEALRRLIPGVGYEAGIAELTALHAAWHAAFISDDWRGLDAAVDGLRRFFRERRPVWAGIRSESDFLLDICTPGWQFAPTATR